MSKTEFLERLEGLLQDIPEEERREALDFYRNYFEDAGEGREDEVLRELGSPERVAAQIKDGLRGGPGNGEYTDTGYQDPRYREYGRVPQRYRKRGSGNGWKILGIILLCIFGLPLVAPVLGVIFAVALTVLALIFSLGIVVAVMTVMGFIVGIIFFIVGVSRLAVAPAVGLLFCGSGMISVAVGILFLLATVWMLGTGLPGFCRWLGSLGRKIFHRRGVERG